MEEKLDILARLFLVTDLEGLPSLSGFLTDS